jgi:hypothetical protein
MESRAGDISASCLTDLKLQSVAGAVSMLRILEVVFFNGATAHIGP